MSLITPILKQKSRRIRRKSLNEYANKLHVLDKSVKQAENDFIKALFTHKGSTYKEIYDYYNKRVDNIFRNLERELTFNHLDKDYFKNKFEPLEWTTRT